MSSARRSLTAVGIEIVVVVGGILIAFGLDAWWDRRQAAVWEVSELEALQDEFSRNLDQFQTIGAIHRDHADAVLAIASALTDAPSGSAVSVPDSLLVKLFWWRTTDVSTGVLDALLGSGQVAAIGSTELRRLLAEWPTKVADGLEDELIARQFVEETLAPRLAGSGAVSTGYLTQLSPFYPMVSTLRGTPELTADAETLDLLSQRLRHLLWSAANAESLVREAQLVLNVLQRELSD